MPSRIATILADAACWFARRQALDYLAIPPASSQILLVAIMYVSVMMIRMMGSAIFLDLIDLCWSESPTRSVGWWAKTIIVSPICAGRWRPTICRSRKSVYRLMVLMSLIRNIDADDVEMCLSPQNRKHPFIVLLSSFHLLRRFLLMANRCCRAINSQLI